MDGPKWLSPLGPVAFLGLGVALFGLKFGVDLAVSSAFGEVFTPLFYISPIDAPLLQPAGRERYWLAMWAVALPFIGVGFWLTVRRLRDARAPTWLAVLFFVPFANLIFFATCVLLPSRPPPAAGGQRATPHDDAQAQAQAHGFGTALACGAAGGAVITLGTLALSVTMLGDYGAALFLGSPVMAGFFGTLIFDRIHRASWRSGLLVTGAALGLSFAAMVLFAFEGAICLLMALPLAALGGVIGMVMAVALSNAMPPRRWASTAAVIPLFIFVEVLAPPPPRGDVPVSTMVIVDAPPEVVWNHVVAFPDLPRPKHWLFRAGVAAPTGATIDGAGVGAVRRCEFTTGTFVEPITVWSSGRELGFRVEAMPEPMKELSPWDIHPRHLDGYFVTTRGRFLLEPMPDGRTRLTGTTWYDLDMRPRAYWSLWSEYLIHEIHGQVLRQVKSRAEEEG